MNNVTYTIEVQPEEWYLAKEEYENMRDLAADEKSYYQMIRLADEADKWLAAIRNEEYVWNWCSVVVKATYTDYDTGIELEGWDSLGCCSYPDGEDQFKACDYYKDMCDNALSMLMEEMSKHIALGEKLKALVTEKQR